LSRSVPRPVGRERGLPTVAAQQEPGTKHFADHVRGGQRTPERITPGSLSEKNTNASGAIATGSLEPIETSAQQKTARVAKFR
jgi:hypothetical protein